MPRVRARVRARVSGGPAGLALFVSLSRLSLSLSLSLSVSVSDHHRAQWSDVRVCVCLLVLVLVLVQFVIGDGWAVLVPPSCAPWPTETILLAGAHSLVLAGLCHPNPSCLALPAEDSKSSSSLSIVVHLFKKHARQWSLKRPGRWADVHCPLEKPIIFHGEYEQVFFFLSVKPLLFHGQREDARFVPVAFLALLKITLSGRFCKAS